MILNINPFLPLRSPPPPPPPRYHLSLTSFPPPPFLGLDLDILSVPGASGGPSPGFLKSAALVAEAEGVSSLFLGMLPRLVLVR